jgi:hypothetical protein
VAENFYLKLGHGLTKMLEMVVSGQGCDKFLEKERLKGSTIWTLPETVLIQIIYFFHVFCVYSVLLSTDLTYSRIPGDQEGPIFFDMIFLAVLLRTNWYTTTCILDTNLYPNVSKFTQNCM